MTQQIIDVGAAANDGTGEPLREAFTAVNDNFTQIWAAGPVGTNVKITGNVITTTVTNLGLTLAGNGIGNIQANSTVVPGTSGVYDLGAPDRTFQYIYGDYLVGNGALITGIVANTSYNDSNVAAFLPTYTGNLVSLTGPVRTTANVIAGNLITSGFLGVTGNITGGNITGNNLISSGYVSAVGNITTTANVAGNYFIGNGAFLTGITATNISAAALTGTTLSSNVLYSSLKVVDDLLYLDVIGNVTTQGQFSGSGAGLTNVPASNITGQVANALVAGTVYTNAQPNITSVGTLTSLTATGNIAGNYFVGNGSLLTGIAATNVNANALVGDTLSSNVLYSSLKVVDDLLYLDVVGNVTTQGRFIGSGAGLINIPGANVTGQVAAASTATTAGTVTTAAQPNITSVGTLTSLTATGNVTANYFIGNGSQLTGITATNVSASALTGATLSANVLNSTLVSVGNLNNLSVIGNAVGGNFLTAGIVSATGNITTANYFIGNGRQLTGIQSSEVGVLANLSVTGNTVTGNLLTGGMVSAVGNIKTTANVTGNYFIGNGSQLTGIIASAGAAITNGNSNVTVNANGNVTVGVVGTSNVTVFADTGAYVTGEVSATGNITGNYLLGNGALITGLPSGYSNADVANYLPTYTGNLVSLTGPVTTTSNITGGNVLTGGLISATGNVTGNYILGNGALLTGVITSVANINDGTSNVTVVSSGGNVTVGVGGTANVAVFATTGEYITGVLSANGNVTGGNLLTSGLMSAISNITGGNLLTQGLVSATGTITSSANITGGNVLTDGLVSAAGTVTGSSLLASVVSASGDVTGGNVLTGGLVSATANVTGGNLLTAGQLSAAGNITGNYILGNGSQLTGVAASSVYANALIGNTLSSNVLYSSLTQVGTLANLSVTGNTTGGNLLTGGLVSATGSVTSAANIVGGNITTAGQVTSTTVSASANVTGGNVLTGGIVSATGNILAGNVITAGPSGNISGANVISGTTFTATGNITGGNVVTGGLISATGNIQGNVFIGNGAGLTSLTGANVTGTVANATYALNANSATYADHANIADVANSVSGSNVSGQVANALIAGTVYTNAQPNITSVGTLTSLTSSGNVTGGNLLTGGLISSTGTITSADNITGGNLLTGGLISATSTITTAANITGGNVLTGGLISATSTITGSSLLGSVASLSGNVTGGNLVTAGLATVSGNITGGNLLTAGLISATGNIQGGNVNTNQLRNASGNLTIGVTSGNLLLQPSGNIVLSANTYINNLAYPAQDGDAATKQYVDNFATTGISYHQPVAAATTTTLATTTGGSITYTQPNGVANGVGALLTTTGSFNLIDTANVQTVGTRILVKNEANAVFNGVYTWANSTNIIRSSDADSYGADQTDHFSINDYFYTTGGNVNAGTAFIVSAPAGVITFGTSNIEFSTFSTSQVYSANTSAGISLNGTVINAKVDDNTTAFDGGGNIVVKAGANLTTPNIGAATGTSISLTGNATSGNVLTGGVVSATANVIGGNVLTGGLISATSTITSAANITGGNLLTGGLISSTGTITSAANVNANNVIATTIVNAPSLTGTIASLSGNVTGGNVLTGGLISATSTITSAANITGGNLVTGGAVTATGNITGGNIITSGSGGNITGANVISGTTLTATGNVIGGNVLTGGVISATSTVTGSSLLGTVASLSGNVTGGNILTGGLISATGNITGGNIVTVGKISTSGNVYGNAILSDNYFYANGQPIPTGIVYTAATSPPAGPDIGDQWYDTTSDVLYEYINDGTSNYWVDTTSPAFAGGVVANVAISGTLVPIANVTYDIGTSSVYFRNTYTQNLYTNNRLPAYNMPLGAVVQTVMSSSLGGSVTNSTSYADITYANVTITTSSAASKVLIIATGTSSFSALAGENVTADTQLVRSPSTSLQIQTCGTLVSGGGVGVTGAISYSYLDSPATNGAITYKLQQRVSNASSTLTSTNIWLIALEIASS